MAQKLRANTAVDVLIGPFVEDGDGDTPVTGSTLVVELSKNGQALATKNEGTNPSHDAAGTVDGYYNCILDTTDTNTEGQLTLVVHHADSLPIRHDYDVLAEAAWDSMFVAKDDGFMDVNIKTIGATDTTETAADNLEAMYDGTGYIGGSVKMATDMTFIHGTALSESTAGNLAGNFETFWDDGDDATGTSAYSDVALILADTGELQADDYPTSIAAVQTTVDAIEVGTVTNATGADVATDVVALKAETVLILADTGELQADDYPTSIAAVQTTVDAIEVDTGTTLQGELDGIQADTEDIQARLPAALAGAYMSSDAAAISGSTAAAVNLEASAEVIVIGAAEAGTLSTTVMTSDLAEATNDHYNGRVIVWTSGDLLGQATDITDYAGVDGTLTFTATTEAPSAADTFVIV